MSETTKGATLLIVEDKAILALHMRQKLERLGYAVLGIVATGEAAVALALDRHRDVVLPGPQP